MCIRDRRHLGDGRAGGLRERPHRVDDLRLVVVVEEVGHLARVEDVVDVLEEGLLDDLRVGEEEGHQLALLAAPEQDLLAVVAPLRLAVRLGDLDLEALVLGDGRREPRERLAARAADAEEQAVAARLAQHARDARDVRDGVDEHDERHLLGVLRVVVLEVLLDGRDHLGHVRDLRVDARVGARHHKVAVEQLCRRHRHDVVPSHPEVVRHQPAHLAVEPLAVVVADEAVAVDAQVLVHPQPHDVGRLGERLDARRQHALHDGRDVAQ
eukprot:4159641-Prymnesium_polylepis.1